jgi:hypothetical protein
MTTSMKNIKNNIPQGLLSVAGAIALATLSTSMMVDSASAAALKSGESLTVNYSQAFGGGTVKALLDFKVDSLTSSVATLLLKVTNNTTLGTLTNAGLASIGFSADPNATAVAISQVTGTGESNKFDGATLGNIPSLSKVEICAWSGNNCNGGGQNDLLAVGQTDTFKLTLNGAFNTATGINFDDFGVKFQTSAGSTEFYGTSSITTPPPPGGGGGGTGAVPEPLTMLGAGAAVAFGSYFKKRADKNGRKA